MISIDFDVGSKIDDGDENCRLIQRKYTQLISDLVAN